MAHFVRIELAYPTGWWKINEHARLSDPPKYASTLLARPPAQSKGAVIGVRITDHDSGEVWTSGQEPDEGTAYEDPTSGESQWEDLLGDPSDDDETPSWEDLL